MVDIKKISYGTIVLWVIFVLMSSFSLKYQLYFNKTDSLPEKIFYVSRYDKLPQKEGKIMFSSPKFAVNSDEYMVKIIKGVPGDKLTIHHDEFYINGECLGKVKKKSNMGRKLLAVKPGVIPSGKYFVWTPHVDSYDSRYFEIGLIDEKNIIGVAHSFV